MTIFERRNVSTDGIVIYSASSHHQSHRLHREYALIYTTSREKDRNHKRGEIYGCRHSLLGRKKINKECYDIEKILTGKENVRIHRPTQFYRKYYRR